MQVQYLVGLCCLKAHPDAVELMLSDMVVDSSTETKRDVDITVILKDANGNTSAFKGYEVKDIKGTVLFISREYSSSPIIKAISKYSQPPQE